MQAKLIYISILVSLLLSSTSCKKEDGYTLPDKITSTEELTQALDEIYLASDAPGFSVSIFMGSSIIYKKAFGMANIAESRPYTNSTTQPIGSISKTFIAAALVKAIEEGYFTLETDINTILPFTVVNPNHPNDTIRVRHLVTHTSGLIDNSSYYNQSYFIEMGEDVSGPGAQLMIDLLGSTQRNAIPLSSYLEAYYSPTGNSYSPSNFSTAQAGSEWQYSNIASSLAALLIETATGTDFKDYVRQKVWQPLGMNNTSYDYHTLPDEHEATLYFDKHTPLPRYSNDSYPDGSVMTNNNDMSLYLQDMILGVSGRSTVLFSDSMYQLLFRPLLPIEGDNQSVFWLHSNGIITHDGSDPGTTCDIAFNKNGNHGYVLLTNMDASTEEHETAFFQLQQRVKSAVDKFIQSQ